MQEQVLHFINQHKLFSKDDRLLVAVSGGQDSVVLAEFLHRQGYDIGIAHCNFQLRGKESDGDEAFVKALAKDLSVPYHVQRFNTKAFSKGMGLSTQEAARELRYAWFHELMEVHGYECILTAHHKRDQLETVLINQIRGTGLKGLRGIPLQNGFVCRPFLETDKPDIEQYAQRHKIKWRDDSSNMSEEYLRNQIRLQLLPVMKKLEPNVENIFSKNAQKASEAFDLLTFLLDDVISDMVDNESVEGDFKISIDRLGAYPHPHIILYQILNRLGFSFEQSKAAGELLDSESGKMIQNEDYGVWRDREHLWIRRVDNIPFMLEIPDVGTYEFPYGTLEISMVENKNIDFKTTPRNQCLLDAGKLEFPLLVRNWEDGDRFQPLGMTGTKLVSDFFIDLKLPVFKKKQIPIVLSADKIVWVGGFRPDHRFKVEPGSKQVIRISFT